MLDSDVFVLYVLDKDGFAVPADHIHCDSLLAAALVGHELQERHRYVVRIINKSDTPHKEYWIDEKGKPIPFKNRRKVTTQPRALGPT